MVYFLMVWDKNVHKLTWVDQNKCGWYYRNCSWNFIYTKSAANKQRYSSFGEMKLSCILFVVLISFNYVLFILVWCPGQTKRISSLPFFHGCRKKRLKRINYITHTWHRLWLDMDRFTTWHVYSISHNYVILVKLGVLRGICEMSLLQLPQ
jgi:hypothetical protein